MKGKVIEIEGERERGERERSREKERERIFLLDQFAKDHSFQGWTKLILGVRNVILVSHVSSKGGSTWPSSSVLPGVLSENWTRNRASRTGNSPTF